MLQGLQKAFLNFVDTTQTRLQDIRKQVEGNSLGKAVSRIALPWVVEELENRQEFHQLVTETRPAFSGVRHRKSTEELWRRAVHNYFCRSGYYLGLASGEFASPDGFFSSYCVSFTEPKVQTTYLAPLEFVHFAESCMDFDTFQIKRFPIKELETILQNRVNSIFYPWAAISSDSLKLLSQYWFIQITEPADPSQIGVFTLPASSSATLLFSGYAEREYTGFPPAVESALRQLCLFDWPSINKGPGARNIMSRREAEHAVWLKFDVPIVLKINDDLIDFPERMPIIPELETEPLLDPETREELGPVPLVKVHLDQAETQHFVTFMKHIGDMMRSLEKGSDSWSFLEIALGYFTKAFLVQPNLEQLLWHIVVLEALLGEGPEGVTERLARRIGLILGKDKNERQNISKRFRKLYEVRSSLIHGKSQSRADVTAIIDAYRFSRLAIIWFLNYLSNIQYEIAKCKTGERAPNRQEVLILLDIDADRRALLRWLMDRVPSDFPYVAKWIEQGP